MKKGESGFSPVLVIVVLLVVASVGFVAYRVMNKDSKSNQSPSQSTSTQEQATAKTDTTTNAGFYEIKEWGVRAKYKNTYQLKYVLSDSQKSANFTADELVAADKTVGCGNSLSSDGASGTIQNHGGGLLRRYLGTDTISKGPGDGDTTVKEYVAGLDKTHYVQISEYYYIFFGKQGPCGPAYELQTKVEQDVLSLLKTLELIPT